jgi:hypothetical protein
MRFSELVEEVRHRPLDEQEQLERLLKQEIVKARRERIHRSHETAVEEVRSGKRIPTTDVDEFMRRLDQA